MDTKNIKQLSYLEFRKVLADFKLGLSEQDIKSVFTGFDINKSGQVDYEEFMQIIKVFL